MPSKKQRKKRDAKPNLMSQLDFLANIYTVTRDGKTFHVHVGTCDDIPTKWITQGEWNGKLNLQFVNGEMRYTDGKGNTMYVYEKDEEEWADW